MYIPTDPQEKAIAEALGIRQELLFPERFDADGIRLHPVKHKRAVNAGNVKQKRVA
jgi:lambda repressor-like predicted transcriptional regulator